MLLACADVAVNQADHGGYTALHIAAEKVGLGSGLGLGLGLGLG